MVDKKFAPNESASLLERSALFWDECLAGVHAERRGTLRAELVAAWESAQGKHPANLTYLERLAIAAGAGVPIESAAFGIPRHVLRTALAERWDFRTSMRVDVSFDGEIYRVEGAN